MVATKKFFKYPSGRLGQLRLFLAAHSQPSNQNHLVIHRHFAQLYGPDYFHISSDGSTILQEWTGFRHTLDFVAKAYFPVVGHDVLLYLSLMGGKHVTPGPFRLNTEIVPFRFFWKNYNLHSNVHQMALDASNPAQASNDGMELEAIVIASICVSSHCNGFEGIPFSTFLKFLVYHLQPNQIPPNQFR